MVLKRISFEFEKIQDNKPSSSYDNAPLPPSINVSLVNCTTNSQGDLDANVYTCSHLVSKSKMFSTSLIGSQNKLSVGEESRGSLIIQDNASISCDGDLLNNAFRRTINSNYSYLNNKFDSVSSDSSVFSMPNLSPIPYYDPLDKINQDIHYSQSPVLSSSSDLIKKFYEIKNRKSTSQRVCNDHLKKKIFKMIKEIKTIVNNSNENFVDVENTTNLSENEAGVNDGIAQKTSGVPHSVMEKLLSKEANSTSEDDSVFSTTQFNFEYSLDNQSLDFLLLSPVPHMNLQSSLTDIDNNNHNNDNDLLEDRKLMMPKQTGGIV